MSMGSGEESILSSSCFCKLSATAWMAFVHSSLPKTRKLSRAVVLESGLVFLSSRTCLGLVGIWTRTCLGLGHRTRQMFKLVWSESSNICFFFLFQNKDSLVSQMGNVIAIGLTPSRTGIVIGPSRTGIVIGPLLNAQLRHMSVRAAWRHK